MKLLTYKNNWENDEYYVDGKRVEDLKSVQVDGKIYPVVARRVGVPYNDMGHTYTSMSTHYYITEQVFGTDRQFDLNTLTKVRVYAIDFTLAKE